MARKFLAPCGDGKDPLWREKVCSIIGGSPEDKLAFKDLLQRLNGGFQLLNLIITELKSHMTCYNSKPLIGWNYSI